LKKRKPPIIHSKESAAIMFFWIAAGYVASAVAFYSYIVATAQEDPYQSAATLAETTEWEWTREQNNRKAA